MENCHGLVMDAQVIEAKGSAERDSAVEMFGHQLGIYRITLEADKR